jgi:hypothetical protein
MHGNWGKQRNLSLEEAGVTAEARMQVPQECRPKVLPLQKPV